VDFIHQDLETSVHDLVDFLRVEFFRNGRKVCHIRKKHGHQFPLTLDRTPGRQDLIGQMFGGVGPGLV